jgi:CRP-like cAMP-binding protein
VNNAQDLSRSNNQLLAALSRETLALFEQDLKHVSLAQGVVCYEAGDRIDRVYFPISGMISLLVAGHNGEIVETGVIGREGAAGLQSGLGERRSYNRGEHPNSRTICRHLRRALPAGGEQQRTA